MRKPSNISMTEPQREFADGLVASGAFASVSEVVRAGMRLLQERQERLDALRIEVAKGMADIEAGRVSQASPEDIIAKSDNLKAAQ